MNATVEQRPVELVRPQPTVEEQKQMANAAALGLEMLTSRLAANGGFAEEFIARPKSALGAAGIVLNKEGLEFLMMHDPVRFDQLTDLLFDNIHPDILAGGVGPSCEGVKGQ